MRTKRKIWRQNKINTPFPLTLALATIESLLADVTDTLLYYCAFVLAHVLKLRKFPFEYCG